MEKKKFQQLLSDSFPKTNKTDWNRTASIELNGSEPLNLAWNDKDDLQYLPFYDKDDAAMFQGLRNYDLTPAKDDLYGNRKWFNQPPLAADDVKSANASALLMLQSGADGIFFHVNSKTDFYSLLEKIQVQYCELSFTGHFHRQSLDTLSDFFHNNNSALSGILLSEQQLALQDLPESILSAKAFRPLGLLVQPQSPVKQICEALKRGIHHFDLAEDIPQARIAAEKIAFSFAADVSFLSNIAKLKAFRMLWQRVLGAYGFGNIETYVHCRCVEYVNSSLDPHANMLNNTNTAMSSVLGGCDALSVYPADLNNKTSQRIAKNVSNILKEESHFDKVADPVAGSYVIDAMVHQFCEKAWKNFLTTV